MSGTVVHIEMQARKFATMMERETYYLGSLVTGQMHRSENYDKIHRVISILIVEEQELYDAKLDPERRYHHCGHLNDDKTGMRMNSLLELHTIELSKVPKEDDGDPLWSCSRFLHEKDKEALEMLAQTNPNLSPAYTRWMELNEDLETRALAESVERGRRLLEAQLSSAKDEGVQEGKVLGREEGKVLGMEEGRKRMAMNVAIKMLRRGTPTEYIAEDTGLTLAEIEALKSETANKQR
jgi:predicted transposase/invertase (TIGR01784 family)